MKKLTIILFCITIVLHSHKPSNLDIATYDLAKAVELKLVEFKIDGRAESPHYAQPAHLSLKNLSRRPIKIRIPNGQKLVSNPPTVQDLVVVKEEVFALAGGATREKDLYSMCIQHENSSPTRNTDYTLGEVATGPLKSLTEEIQKREDFNTLGQYSVWTIANNRDLNTIAGYDHKTAHFYQKFVSDLTGRAMPEIDTSDYLTNYGKSYLIKRSIGGKFEYGFSKTSAVSIGLFNEQGIIVRELLLNPEVKAGDHKFTFEFDATAYNDPFYYVRLIINGEIKLNYKMEIRS